jgi:hypothetical protein
VFLRNQTKWATVDVLGSGGGLYWWKTIVSGAEKYYISAAVGTPLTIDGATYTPDGSRPLHYALPGGFFLSQVGATLAITKRVGGMAREHSITEDGVTTWLGDYWHSDAGDGTFTARGAAKQAGAAPISVAMATPTGWQSDTLYGVYVHTSGDKESFPDRYMGFLRSEASHSLTIEEETVSCKMIFVEIVERHNAAPVLAGEYTEPPEALREQGKFLWRSGSGNWRISDRVAVSNPADGYWENASGKLAGTYSRVYVPLVVPGVDPPPPPPDPDPAPFVLNIATVETAPADPGFSAYDVLIGQVGLWL